VKFSEHSNLIGIHVQFYLNPLIWNIPYRSVGVKGFKILPYCELFIRRIEQIKAAWSLVICAP